MVSYQEQKGVALAQVLLLVAIISVLLLSMLHVNQQMIQTTDTVQQRTQLKLALQTAKTRLLEALLTHNWESEPPNAADNLYASRWNFHGEPFEVDGVIITIQNDASLLQITNLNEDYLTSGLEALNIKNARELAQKLIDWQDRDNEKRPQGGEQSDYGESLKVPNRYLQSMSDLAFIPGFNPEIIEKLNRAATVNAHGSYSPTHAPTELLSLFIDKDQAQTVARMREQGNFNERRFSAATGVQNDEFVYLAAGPVFKVTLRAKQNNISQLDTFTVELDPYEEKALTYR